MESAKDDTGVVRVAGGSAQNRGTGLQSPGQSEGLRRDGEADAQTSVGMEGDSQPADQQADRRMLKGEAIQQTDVATSQQKTEELNELLRKKQTKCVICLEDWVLPSQVKENMDEEGKVDSQEPLFAPGQSTSGAPDEGGSDLVNRLLPCDHLQCNLCFVNYQKKANKVKCPVCQVDITHVTIVNCKTMTESAPFELLDYFKSCPEARDVSHGDRAGPGGASGATGGDGNDDHAFESFDHQYFEQEIAKLIKLRDVTEQERFHSRRRYDSAAQKAAEPLEWESLKQIEQRLHDIQEDIYDLMPFNAAQRMMEVHEIGETMVKIRAGRFDVIHRDVFGQESSSELSASLGGSTNAYNVDDYRQDQVFDAGFQDSLDDVYAGQENIADYAKMMHGNRRGNKKKLMISLDPVQYLINGGEKKATVSGGGRKGRKRGPKKGKVQSVVSAETD